MMVSGWLVSTHHIIDHRNSRSLYLAMIGWHIPSLLLLSLYLHLVHIVDDVGWRCYCLLLVGHDGQGRARRAREMQR